MPTNGPIAMHVAPDVKDYDPLGLLRPDHALQGLTGPQELFCKMMWIGHSETNAYRLAYNVENTDPLVVTQMASRAAQLPRVKARMGQLRATWEQRASLDQFITKEEIARGIASLAFDKSQKTSDRLKAYKLLGEIAGVDLFRVPKDDDGKPGKEETLAEVEAKLNRMLDKLKDVTPDASQ